MKQFITIFLFELKGYLKNKIFVGVTLFLIAAMSVAVFIPNIISAVGSSDKSGEREVMLIRSDNAALSQFVGEYFKQAFTGYEIQVTESSVDEIKQRVAEGEAGCAFVLDSLTSYTYYVKNLSMYDTNAAIADGVLQEAYRFNAMVSGGLQAEQAQEIMSAEIKGTTTALGKNQIQNFLYTYVMIIALYMVILLYGQMVATNVGMEKSSRAMELLVTSAKPVNMIFGKVLSSCAAGFIQLVALFGSAIALFNINKKALMGNAIMQSFFNIPVDIFLYMLLFFILGFLIYAFLYGALGSTISKLEDMNTAIMPVTFLAIIAFIVVVISMTSGNIENIFLIICSYIPFTSPMAMFTRIAMGTVVWYEILISVGILAVSVVGIGFLAAKIYRTGVLLCGKRLKLGAVIKSIIKK